MSFEFLVLVYNRCKPFYSINLYINMYSSAFRCWYLWQYIENGDCAALLHWYSFGIVPYRFVQGVTTASDVVYFNLCAKFNRLKKYTTNWMKFTETNSFLWPINNYVLVKDELTKARIKMKANREDISIWISLEGNLDLVVRHGIKSE